MYGSSDDESESGFGWKTSIDMSINEANGESEMWWNSNRGDEPKEIINYINTAPSKYYDAKDIEDDSYFHSPKDQDVVMGSWVPGREVYGFNPSYDNFNLPSDEVQFYWYDDEPETDLIYGQGLSSYQEAVGSMNQFEGQSSSSGGQNNLKLANLLAMIMQKPPSLFQT